MTTLRICLTIPNSKAVNGGIRLINDFADQLQNRGHQVFLMDESHRGPSYMHDNGLLTISRKDYIRQKLMDLTILCSPHSAWVADTNNTGKIVVWLQMLEHMFRPFDMAWNRLCGEFYGLEVPFITNGEWIADWIKNFNKREDVMPLRTWIQDYFPTERGIIKDHVVLIESPVANNNSKDINGLAVSTALKLKDEFPKLKLIGYGKTQFETPGVFDSYVLDPSIDQLNSIYAEAAILIKATQVDGQSCSPLEAMTKGCVTVRAINNGDEELVHEANALICKYDPRTTDLYDNAKRLITDVDLYMRLSANCVNFADNYRFNKFLNEFSQAIKVEL